MYFTKDYITCYISSLILLRPIQSALYQRDNVSEGPHERMTCALLVRVCNVDSLLIVVDGWERSSSTEKLNK